MEELVKFILLLRGSSDYLIGLSDQPLQQAEGAGGQGKGCRGSGGFVRRRQRDVTRRLDAGVGAKHGLRRHHRPDRFSQKTAFLIENPAE